MVKFINYTFKSFEEQDDVYHFLNDLFEKGGHITQNSLENMKHPIRYRPISVSVYKSSNGCPVFSLTDFVAAEKDNPDDYLFHDFPEFFEEVKRFVNENKEKQIIVW